MADNEEYAEIDATLSVINISIRSVESMSIFASTRDF